MLLPQDKEGTWVWPCLSGKCGKEPGKCPFASITPILVPLGGTRWGKAGDVQSFPPPASVTAKGLSIEVYFKV